MSWQPTWNTLSSSQNVSFINLNQAKVFSAMQHQSGLPDHSFSRHLSSPPPYMVTRFSGELKESVLVFIFKNLYIYIKPGCLWFFVVEFSLFILDVNPLSNVFYRYFLPFSGCYFTLLIVPFSAQKFLILMQTNLSTFHLLL